MSQRTKRLESLFHAAMEFASVAERERYLDEACAGDEELRREAEDLLKSVDSADRVFQVREAACRGAQAGAASNLIERPGDSIGRYKLLEKLGEGGMGIVYMAEQEQPIRRKVALKIIKLGMDTRLVVARFEAERQALALMDHPHIARVFDGGATETGRPYFVMELVQGTPITDFCEANRLSVEQRLKLFVSVCHAIQSAHQKAIIHRDIKPSNVLVTMHNGVPHPMVIDFGVAKAVDQKLTGKTLFTNFATMVGTPAYMSPEQAEMSKLDVDTRSDIYSLGVLLYELLTGSTPFPQERLRSLAYGEMQRIIAEEEPERPSTRIRKKSAASLTLRAPRPAFNSDLDWIVMKCLEKHRGRRYETASALAADIQAHLGNAPVVARPPSALYRFQKTVRRNRLAFAAGLAIALTLLGGVITTSWQLARARNAERAISELAAKAIAAEKKALAEAATARAVTDFLYGQLFSSHPYETPTGHHANRRALLEEIAQAIEGKFSDQPLVEEQLRTGIGVGLIGFSDVTNVNRQLERLIELKRKRLPPGHSEILEEMGYLASNYALSGRFGEAQRLLAEAAPYVPETGDLSAGAANILAARGAFLHAQGRPADAVPCLTRAIPTLLQAWGPTDHRMVTLMFSEALVTQEAGRAEEAERLWKKGIRHFEEHLNPEHPAVAQFLKGHAYSLLRDRKSESAIPLLERALSIYRKALPENHKSGLDAEDLLALAHEQNGDLQSAAKLYLRTYPHWLKLIPYQSALGHCWTIAAFFERHGFPDEAITIRRALEAYERSKPRDRGQGLDTQGHTENQAQSSAR